MLSQWDLDGCGHPVADFSKKLLPQEQNYSTVEKEYLAICLGVQAFCIYLLGWLWKTGRSVIYLG